MEDRETGGDLGSFQDDEGTLSPPRITLPGFELDESFHNHQFSEGILKDPQLRGIVALKELIDKETSPVFPL